MRTILKSIHYLALALLLVCSVSSPAQTITGGVNGTVTDPSGAIIPNAKITVVNVATGVTTTDQTNSSGQYALRFLQIGQYKLTIEAPGFATAALGPFALEAGQNAKFDAKMNLEGSNTNVAVSANLSPLLNTDSAELGMTLDSTAIDNIPLAGRNFSSLTIFTPGAVATNPTGFTGSNAIERSTSGSGQVSVNGNRQQSNNFLLDGIEINETINNTIGYNPSPDALGEVRVISANAQAEYGNVNGGDVVSLLKSGTNKLHGSAFYYVTNYNLSANTFANKNGSTIIPKQSSTNNIFGATVGGPIIKDKLFFFGDYSGVRYHAGGSATSTVATAKMRHGDFSELLDPALNTSPGVTFQQNKLTQLYNTSTTAFTPYANNQLPTTPTNPVAAYLYAHPELYPLPNQAPSAGSPVSSNYKGPSKNRIYNDQFDVKIDYKYSEKDSAFARYSQSTAGDTTTNPLVLTFPGASTYPTKGFAFNYVHTFTPSLQNELRIGFFRTVWHQGIPSDSTGVFGSGGNAIVGVAGGSFTPGFSAQSVSALTTVGASATYSDNLMNNFTYGDNLTWQKGKHLIKMGGQFIRYQQNSIYTGNDGAQGTLTYNGNFTINPNVASNINTPLATGYSVADFYLDKAITGARGTLAGHTGQRQWRDAAFVQDDYKFLPNLTINLGLRWEFDQPIYEVNNKEANLNLATGAILIAGQNGASRALYDAVWTNFMPRVGFSYNPVRRLVFRGGFGSTTYLEGTGANLRLTINPPFQTSLSFAGAPPTASSTGSFTTAETAFVAAGPGGVCAYATNPACGQQFRAWDTKLRPSTVNEYSFTSEYQVSNTASLTVGYVGEFAYHLIQANNGNQLVAPCFNSAGALIAYNSAACFAVNKAPFYSLVGQSGKVPITQSRGMMNYNALQAVYRQRISRGLQYTVNYAYSKSMTNSIGFYGVSGISNATAYASNPRDTSIEYGPAGTDATHNLNFNMTYELPFGRGRMFGGNMNRLFDEVAGGWKFAATGFLYSGFPITLPNTSNNSGVNSGQQRALHYRKLKVVNRNVNQWFGNDPSTVPCGQVNGVAVDNGVCAYGAPTDGTISTARPNSERVPGYRQFDMSMFKDFSVTEAQRVSFRIDASNVFNISSYSNPTATPQSATFGKITANRSGPRQIQLSAKYIF
jgi:hypothetical protein